MDPLTTRAAYSSEEGTSEPATEALFTLEGMWCGGCALAIEHRLRRLAGISRVGVDYASATLLVEGEPVVIRREALARPLAKLGYRLCPLEDGQGAQTRLDAESHRLAARLMVAAVFGMWTMLASLLIYVGAMPEPRLERILAWVSGAFALPVIGYAGLPFYRAACRTIRAGCPGMDALVSLGVFAALGISIWLLGRGAIEVYFDTAVMLIVLLLAGRWIETLARYRGLRALQTLVPPAEQVRVLRESGDTMVSPREVLLGEHIRVASGERVPLDGVLLDAAARLDLSPLTGESRPQWMTRGDRVMAGSHNRGEALTLVVTARSGECRMDRLYREMQRAQASKNRHRALAERFAAWLSPLALGLALITLSLLLLVGISVDEALVRALSVLVVACPCAVGLAVPLASLAGTARGLEQGVIFRDPVAMEVAGNVRSVAFDKTGTLTLGELAVTTLKAAPELNQRDVLRIAARIEWGSEHPVGRAIRRHAMEEGVPLDEAPWKVEDRQGRGRVAWLVAPCHQTRESTRLSIGAPAWLTELGVAVPADDMPDSMSTRVDVAEGRCWLGTLWLTDVADHSAAPLLASLRGEGIDVALISGDRAPVVHRIGRELGVADTACFAERRPEQKLALVSALSRPSLYVGDGINDAPALAAATLGIAPLGASTQARDAAAIQLLRPGLAGVRMAIDTARATRRVMSQNLVLSMVYNALALFLAVWMPIPPPVAVLAMALSSVSVVGNSARLMIRSSAC